MVRVRFAPSPTGLLHQGNVRTALFNFLFAKHNQGRLILRIEDTDQERSEKSFEDSIYRDLKWLGIEYDESPMGGGEFGPYRQSERHEIYKKYLNQLLQEGRVYSCFCTHEELEAERRKALASGQAYRYSGKCRDLKEEDRQAKVGQGLAPSYRFRVEREIVKFQDLVYGEKVFDTGSFGDFVVARSNDLPLYLFACAIDDCLMKVTHIIRGEDGMSNAPRQILIMKALGFDPPQFGHLPLILGPDHTLLSKRNGSTPVSELEAKGYLPQAILNYLALLGWSPPDNKEVMDLASLTDKFDLGRVARSSAVFDWAKLNHINQVHLRKLNEADYLTHAKQAIERDKVMLGDLTPEQLDQTLLALRPNLETLGELKMWLELLLSDPALSSTEAQETLKSPEGKKVLQGLASLIQEFPEEFADESFHHFSEELKKKTKLKGKKLFWPIRIALTGSPEGPELAALFPALGKAKVLGRIQRALESV